MRALSRKFFATSAPMPSIPRASRTSPSGTWSCSRAPIRRCGGPIWRARPAHRVGDLLRIEAVGDPVVGRELVLQARREPLRRVLADETGADAGKVGDRLDEAQRRIEEEGGDEDDR